MIVPTADRSKATVMVKVRFLEPDPRILPEMSAKVAFLSRPVTKEEERPRTAVSKAAVVRKPGTDVLYVVKNNRVEERPVRLGDTIGDMKEVLEGAKAGERVVLNPPPGLHNGLPVKIAEK